MTELAVPDYVAPLEGWRVWTVAARGGRLRLGSLVYDVAWPAGSPLVAECLHERRLLRRPWRTERPSHVVPDESCRCGIYAVGDPHRLASYLDSRYPVGDGSHRVVGRVSLWGRVVEGERGWRVARAYPSRLWVPLPVDAGERAHAERTVAALRDYGVPVELAPQSAVRRLLASGGTAAEAA